MSDQDRYQGRHGWRLADREDDIDGQICRGELRVSQTLPFLCTPTDEEVCSEDYIQTLGVNFMEKPISIRNTEITFSVSSFHLDNTLPDLEADMGSRGSARICVHAPASLERRCRYFVYVRPDAENHPEQREGVVQTSSGLQ